MSQSIEQQLSANEHQLIEEYQLGTPLAIYRSALTYVRLLRGGGLFLLIAGILVSVFIFTILITGRYHGDEVILAINIGMAGVSLLFGLFILYVNVPRTRNEKRIIICEHGLLQDG